MVKTKEYQRAYRAKLKARSEEPDLSYRLTHRPGDPRKYPDEVATIDKLTTGEIFPSDFLEHPEWYLPDTRTADARETLSVLRSVQGNPDAVVTIYRGAPSDYINTGDWVTLSRGYAEVYAGDGAYSDNPNSRVLVTTAKASELSFDGDSLYEFGYWGKRKRSD